MLTSLRWLTAVATRPVPLHPGGSQGSPLMSEGLMHRREVSQVVRDPPTLLPSPSSLLSRQAFRFSSQGHCHPGAPLPRGARQAPDPGSSFQGPQPLPSPDRQEPSTALSHCPPAIWAQGRPCCSVSPPENSRTFPERSRDLGVGHHGSSRARARSRRAPCQRFHWLPPWGCVGLPHCPWL